MPRINFNCFKSITIVNDNGSNSCLGTEFDFTSFDYIDLSYYGGDTFETVSSNQDIIDLFTNLNVEVKIENCEIFILDPNLELQDIPGRHNKTITLVDSEGLIFPCNSNIFDFSSFNRIDLSSYGGNSIVFVYNNQDIISNLFPLLNTDSTYGVVIEIVDCNIILHRYTGEVCEDIDVDDNPTITVIGGCDFSLVSSIDLSYYGGSVINEVYNEQDIIDLFNDLGIIATINSCVITLNEYIDPVEDIPSCNYEYISFIDTNNTHCNSNSLDFDEINYIDMSNYGLSNNIEVTNIQDIIDLLISLNIDVEVEECRLKIISPLCTPLTDIPTRKAVGLTVIDINIPDCQESGMCWTYDLINSVVSDLEGQNVSVTNINGFDVSNGDVIEIEPGLTVELNNDTVITVCSPEGYSNTNLEITFTITNEDNQSDTGVLTMCWDVQPIANPDMITIMCNSQACVNVITNDLNNIGVVVTHINMTPVVADQTINILPGFLTATLANDSSTICIESFNNYSGTGTVTYTISNGSFTSSSTVDYEVEECDPCITLGLDFNTTSDCGELCYEQLTSNGVPVNNYILQFLDENGNPVSINGNVFQIGSGNLYDPTTMFPNSDCIPFPSGTYNVYVVQSDVGDDLNCIDLEFIHLPVLCDGTTCFFNYSGPAGAAASLEFDIEVCGGAEIIIEDFDPQSVPDGLVVEYNGMILYHTGASPSMPYITGSSNQTTFNCNGVNYTAEQVPDPTNIIIPVPYVVGIETASISVQGNPCSFTAWTLSISCTCNN